MYDRQIPMSRFWAASGWTAVAALLASAWLAWVMYDSDIAVLLGLTACATSAAAAVATIRCYAIRVARLIRLAGHLGDTTPGEVGRLRSVGD